MTLFLKEIKIIIIIFLFTLENLGLFGGCVCVYICLRILLIFVGTMYCVDTMFCRYNREASVSRTQVIITLCAFLTGMLKEVPFLFFVGVERFPINEVCSLVMTHLLLSVA